MSDYLTTKKGADFVGLGDTKRPVENFWRYLRRRGIKTVRRGRRLLVRQADLEAQLIEDDKLAKQVMRAKARQRMQERQAS